MLPLFAVLAGCVSKPAVSPSGLRLNRVSFSALPDAGKSAAALAAFRSSCTSLAGKPPETVLAYAGTVADWREVCAAAVDASADFFQTRFTPYAIDGEAFFTGYYEPQISGSRSRHGAF